MSFCLIFSDNEKDREAGNGGTIRRVTVVSPHLGLEDDQPSSCCQGSSDRGSRSRADLIGIHDDGKMLIVWLGVTPAGKSFHKSKSRSQCQLFNVD